MKIMALFGKSSDARTYLTELMSEREKLTGHAARLVDQEIQRMQNQTGTGNGARPVGCPLMDIHKGRSIRLQVRVQVPVKDHPNFNFVGKLLGPKGNSLKRLQEDTQTKMAILGRGSMRDKAKEEELRKQKEPKYWHLHEELHVEVSAFAPPAEAYGRMAHALSQLKPFLVPDYHDEIRQTQLRELALLKGEKKKMNGQTSGSQSPSPCVEVVDIGNGNGLHRDTSSPSSPSSPPATRHPLQPGLVLSEGMAAPTPSRNATRAYVVPGSGRLVPLRLTGPCRKGALRAAAALALGRTAVGSLHHGALEFISADCVTADEFLYGDEYPDGSIDSGSYEQGFTTTEEQGFARHHADNLQDNGFAADGEFMEWTEPPLRSHCHLPSRLKPSQTSARRLYRPYGPLPSRF